MRSMTATGSTCRSSWSTPSSTQIWQRVEHEIKEHGRVFEDEGTTEAEAREQYRKIAERRVRLGLVVAEVGNKNKIEVTDDEHQAGADRRGPPLPRPGTAGLRLLPQEPAGAGRLRAPVFENKVVDYRRRARQGRPTSR